MELSLLALSENLRPQIENNPQLEILGDPREIEFDTSGNLVSMLAQLGEMAHMS